MHLVNNFGKSRQIYYLHWIAFTLKYIFIRLVAIFNGFQRLSVSLSTARGYIESMTAKHSTTYQQRVNNGKDLHQKLYIKMFVRCDCSPYEFHFICKKCGFVWIKYRSNPRETLDACINCAKSNRSVHMVISKYFKIISVEKTCGNFISQYCVLSVSF